MEGQNNFVFSFQQFLQLKAVQLGYPYFPNIIGVLFDENYYLSKNPDVLAAVQNGVLSSGSQHFFANGVREQRSPSPFFDEDLYLAANPDIKAAVERGAQSSGLSHFVQFGFREGRDALGITTRIGGIKLSALFDEQFYLQQYKDIANSVATGKLSYGFEHFIRFGLKEGRNPSYYYNEDIYFANNPDVKRAVEAGRFHSGLDHYLRIGHTENRRASLLFDPNTYRNNNPDVARAVDRGNFQSLFQHFLEYGAQEGRQSSLLFEEAYYLKNNPDVKRAVDRGVFPSGYAHFLQVGIKEGREPSAFYNEEQYLLANPDVQRAVGRGVLSSGLEHYLKVGLTEDRPLAPSDSSPIPNQPPAAKNDTAATQENTAVVINVLNNDADPDGNPLSVVSVSTPANGSAVINPNGTVTYTPKTGFVGVENFNYSISDGKGGTDAASVTVTITASDDLSYASSNQAVLVDLSENSVSRLTFGANFRLLPMGDSITEGWDASKTVANNTIPNYRDGHEGYRLDLQNKFQALGLPVDFVGSLQHGPGTLLDKDHEGQAGKSFSYFLENVGGTSRINQILNTQQPDVILLMLGTNENETTAMVSGMNNLLNAILANSNFTGHVLVGTIAPAHPNGQWAFRNSRFTAYNDQLDDIVASKNSDRLKLVQVGSLLSSTLDMADPSIDNGLHPNQQGYAKMANAWYAALEDLLIAQQGTFGSNKINVVGSSLNDVLIGDAQVNVLEGGEGDDVLTGKGGNDRFRYRSLADGFDTITDFTAGDLIEVFDSGFAGNLGAGFNFVSGSSPGVGNSQPTFLYDTDDGILSYDADGTGGQSAAALLQLQGAPALLKSQIVIA